jgi:hypothetical protein
MRIKKDPNALLDYKVDWSEWLVDGDTLTGDEWEIATTLSDTDTFEIESHAHDTTSATAWISGGTPGEEYDVTCRITTAHGRIDDRTFTLVVEDR